MGTRNHFRRSGLFLVRIWAEQTEDGTGQVEYHGKVQRVADGEAHQFHDRADLLKLLAAMLESRRNETDGKSSHE